MTHEKSKPLLFLGGRGDGYDLLVHICKLNAKMRSQHNTCSPLIFPMGVSKHYGIQRGEVAVDVEDINKT